MRHLLSALALLSCLALAAAALDQVGRHSNQAGVLLVVTRGDPGPSLAALLKGQDVRVLQVWMGGRVAQLHAPSLARVDAPRNAVLAMFRMPVQALALPACG